LLNLPYASGFCVLTHPTAHLLTLVCTAGRYGTTARKYDAQEAAQGGGGGRGARDSWHDFFDPA